MTMAKRTNSKTKTQNKANSLTKTVVKIVDKGENNFINSLIFTTNLNSLSTKIERDLILCRIQFIMDQLKKNNELEYNLGYSMLNITLDCGINAYHTAILQTFILMTSTNYNLLFSNEYAYFNTYFKNFNETILICNISSLNIYLCSVDVHFKKILSVLEIVKSRFIFIIDNSITFNVNQKHISKSSRQYITSVINPLDLEAKVFCANNNVEFCTDIDAMFGPLSFGNAVNVFRDSIEFNFNVRKSLKIYGKTAVAVMDNKIIEIKSLEHYKIGTINTFGGPLSLFYVFPNIKKDTNENVLFLHLLQMFNNLKKSNLAKTSITSTSINIDNVFFELRLYEISEVFLHFKNYNNSKNLHKNDFLFVESFGNKNKMATSGTCYTKINENLNRIFVLDSFPYLQIDLAISLTHYGNILFLHPEFFENIIIQPDYYPLFNSFFANVNQRMYSLTDNSLNFKCSPSISKLNFYSSLQDVLDTKEHSHMPKYSLALLKSNLNGYNLCGSQKNSVNEFRNLNNIFIKMSTISDLSWSYRLETRVHCIAIIDVLDVIVSKVNKSNVFSFETNPFFKLMSSNCQLFLNQLIYKENLSFEEIFNMMIAEYLFTKSFCNGTSNMNILPIEFHHYSKSLFIGKMGYSTLDLNFSSAYNLASQKSKDETFLKLLKYDKALSAKMLDVFIKILNIKNLNLNQVVKMIIDQYCMDFVEKLKLNTSLENLEILKQNNYLNNSQYNCNDFVQVNIDIIILQNFGESNIVKWRKMPYRCFIDEYISFKKCSRDLILNEIKQYLLYNNCDMLFNVGTSNKKLSLSSKTPFCILKNFTGALVNLSSFDFNNNFAIVLELYNQFLMLNTNPVTSVRNIWSKDEELRLIAGRKFYNQKNGCYKGVWSYLEKSAIFGFIFVKTAINMKFKYSNLIKNKDLYDSYDSSLWLPEYLPLSDRFNALRNFGYELNNEQLNIYNHIFRLEIKDYNDFLVLQQNTNYENLSDEQNTLPKSILNNYQNMEITIQKLYDKVTILISIVEEHNKKINTLNTNLMLFNNSNNLEIHGKVFNQNLSNIPTKNSLFFNNNELDVKNEFSNSHLMSSKLTNSYFENELDNESNIINNVSPNDSKELKFSSKHEENTTKVNFNEEKILKTINVVAKKSKNNLSPSFKKKFNVPVKSKDSVLVKVWTEENIFLLHKIYTNFKYAMFELTDSRLLLFCNKNRPSIENWKKELSYFVNLGFIEVDKNLQYFLCKNIHQKKPELMDKNYVFLLKKFNFNTEILANVVNKYFFLINPNYSEKKWNVFIKKLVDEKLLDVITKSDARIFYKFINKNFI